MPKLTTIYYVIRNAETQQQSSSPLFFNLKDLKNYIYSNFTNIKFFYNNKKGFLSKLMPCGYCGATVRTRGFFTKKNILKLITFI